MNLMLVRRIGCQIHRIILTTIMTMKTVIKTVVLVIKVYLEWEPKCHLQNLHAPGAKLDKV